MSMDNFAVFMVPSHLKLFIPVFFEFSHLNFIFFSIQKTIFCCVSHMGRPRKLLPQYLFSVFYAIMVSADIYNMQKAGLIYEMQKLCPSGLQRKLS